MAWEPNMQQKKDLFNFFQMKFGKKSEQELTDGNPERGALMYSRLSTAFKRALGEQYEQLCRLENPVEYAKLMKKPLSETAKEMEEGPEQAGSIDHIGKAF